MKILFVLENYVPIVSGVPVVAKYLAEGLAKRGCNVSIVTQRPEGTKAEELIDGVMVNRYDIHRNKLYVYSGEVNEYVDFVINNGADILVLECSECFTTDLLLPYLKDFKGKVLFHSHGMSGFTAKFFAFRDSLKHTLGTTYNWINAKLYFNVWFKKAFKYIDAFMCLSEVDSGIDYVRKFAKKVYILDNACNAMFFRDDIPSGAIHKYCELENEHYLISCANYSVVKNQKEMIRQFYQSDSSRSYSLACIGSQDNSYYRECLKLVEKLEVKYGHRDVYLLHGVERNDIPSILRDASIYLTTSDFEQYSISIIEAMSQGVPFISTNVGNAKLLPGGKTLSHVRELHTQIDELLANEEEYRNYSEKGRDFAYKKCRVESVVEKLDSIIKETVGEC